MSKQTITRLIDDIDGSEATETIVFSIDGATYEIDLNEAHASALRKSFEEWSSKAAQTGRKRRTRSSSAKPYDARAVRAWAAENGYDVPAKGRIRREVREAYDAAH